MKTTSKRKKKSLCLKGWETLDYYLLFFMLYTLITFPIRIFCIPVVSTLIIVFVNTLVWVFTDTLI